MPIPDQLFKALKHTCKGYETFLKGATLESGYKPDFVLKCGNEYIILESENSSSRKTFVGALTKAAHFLQGERTGTLVLVIVPKKNTKASSIAKHLKNYFIWIKSISNIKEVYVIDAKEYLVNEKVIIIGCKNFKNAALRV